MGRKNSLFQWKSELKEVIVCFVFFVHCFSEIHYISEFNNIIKHIF